MLALYNISVYSYLSNALRSEAPYIASLGPKKRFEKIANDLKAQGKPLTSVNGQRLYAPCGLEIGANTPEEIAVSLFGEILSAFNGKKGGMLRYKEGPIHERN